MNKQLHEFVREQVKHGVKPEVLRYNLINKGWTNEEVNESLREAHLHNNKTLAIVGISIVVTAFLILILVSLTTKPILPDVEHIPVVNNDDISIDKCISIQESEEKNDCYLVLVEKNYDCNDLTDEIEKSYCFRALEYNLITQ